MQVAVRGSKVEVSADLPSSVAPLVMRASGKARGLHFRPWIVTGAACQHPAFVLWYKQPPERRGPSPEAWKTLANDQELLSMFAGLVDICVHRCTQLAHSTLDRPVFDLELEGVPEDWQGAWLGASDNRLPDRVLERATRSSRQGRYQSLGPRARMTRPEGSGEDQQRPEAAREAADHTGDLAMANAESAVVDVDEEDEDIL